MNFRGGQAGFVRMELEAKDSTKFIHLGRFGGKYVPQMFVIEVVFECFCPAKIHHMKRFLEKIIEQECPANVGFWRFDWEGGSGKIGFCDCFLRNPKIRQIYLT